MTVEEKQWLYTIKEFISCNNMHPDAELNNWESDFIDSLKEYFDLSEKQHNCLEKIYNKF